MHTLKSGDHVLVCDDVYGGTNRYMRVFMKGNFGVDVEFIDMSDLEHLEKSIK